MTSEQLAKLQKRGVPQAILGRLVLLGSAVAVPSPAPLPVPPPESLVPVLPAKAAVDPLKKPTRLSATSYLSPVFELRLWLAIDKARKDGLNISVYETLRYPARQAWLYASGRTRRGDIVTNAPTVFSSWHGYGLAADCVFIRGNEWYWPPSDSSLWQRWLGHAATFGLTTGLHWTSVVDAPHTQPRYLSSTPAVADRQLLQDKGLLGVWYLYDQFVVSPSLFDLL